MLGNIVRLTFVLVFCTLQTACDTKRARAEKAAAPVPNVEYLATLGPRRHFACVDMVINFLAYPVIEVEGKPVKAQILFSFRRNT